MFRWKWCLIKGLARQLSVLLLRDFTKKLDEKVAATVIHLGEPGLILLLLFLFLGWWDASLGVRVPGRVGITLQGILGSLTKGRTSLKSGKALLSPRVFCSGSTFLAVLPSVNCPWVLTVEPGQVSVEQILSAKLSQLYQLPLQAFPHQKVRMKPGNIIFEQAGVGAGGDWGGKSHYSFLRYGLEMCSMPFLPSDKKRYNQTNPKLYKQSKWSSSHCFSLHLLPKCFLADEEWWDLPLLEEFSSHQSWNLSAQERVISAVPESSLFLGKSRLSREVWSSQGLLCQRKGSLFFKEPPWNVFILWEKWAYNFPELLAPFQTGIVLCASSSWGQGVVIAALGRMGGEEIPFSLQPCALFFSQSSLGLEALWALKLRADPCTLSEARIACCLPGNTRGVLGVILV